MTDRLQGLLQHRVGPQPGQDWSVHVLGLTLTGRALYLAALAVLLLLLSAALAVRMGGEIRTRWITWALILPVIGIPIWAGRVATAVLAVVLAVGAVLEFARLARLRRPDGIWLLGCAVVLPVATAGIGPFTVGTVGAWVPWAILGAATAPLLGSDSTDGFRRAAMTSFGIVWICWSLANLPLLGRDAFVVLFAAACADVGAFVAGKSLRRRPWAARGLTSISPNKTWGGVLGALVAAAAVLLVTGSLSVGLLAAVWIGGIAGDLLESMLKRQEQVKDAGAWLPGFGGLLDRIDSLLIAVPLAVLLG